LGKEGWKKKKDGKRESVREKKTERGRNSEKA
jgi:hypothetical protein